MSGPVADGAVKLPRLDPVTSPKGQVQNQSSAVQPKYSMDSASGPLT